MRQLREEEWARRALGCLSTTPPLRHCQGSWVQTQGRLQPKRCLGCGQLSTCGASWLSSGCELWILEGMRPGRVQSLDGANQECGAAFPAPSDVSLLGQVTSPHPGLPDQGSFQWDRESWPWAPFPPYSAWADICLNSLGLPVGPLPEESQGHGGHILILLPRPALPIKMGKGYPNGIIFPLPGSFPLGLCQGTFAPSWASVLKHSGPSLRLPLHRMTSLFQDLMEPEAPREEENTG